VIDKLAVVDPSAKIAEDVTIGPWTFIGPNVEIGAGTKIGPHAVIKGPTKLGKNNQIFQFASIGEDPQDLKFQGEETHLEVGDGNIFREFCTINRGTEQGGGLTKIGDNNLFMAYTHMAHDCIVGNSTIFANGASLAGHVIVEDYAIMSAFSGIHQFCKIGAHSFVAKATIVAKDVLPYVLVSGNPASPCGLNTTGLRRRSFTAEAVANIRRAYRIIFRNGLTAKQAIVELHEMLPECPEVDLLIKGLETSERGIAR